MMVFLLLLWITCLCFFTITKNYRKEQFRECNSKEFPMLLFYPSALFIYEKCRFHRIAQKEQRAVSAYQQLERKGDPKERFQWFVLKKLSIVLLILFCTLTLGLVVQASELLHPSQVGILIVDSNESGTTKSLRIRTAWGTEDDLTIEMPSRETDKISEQEMQRMEQQRKEYETAYEYIDQTILKNNTELSFVGSNLNLLSSIPGLDVTVCWETEPGSIIEQTGVVHNENLKNPVNVSLKGAIFNATGGEIGIYQTTVCVIPKEQYEYVQWKQELEKKIEDSISESSGITRIQLPEEYKGKRIEWVTRKGDEALYLVLLGIIVSIAIYVEMNEELQTQLKKRKKQMLYDYPNIINKLALLIGAGMTVSGAWERIVKDYLKISEKDAVQRGRFGQEKKAETRYAYEEMRITSQQLAIGVSEVIAFEEFGQRSGIVEYMKLSSVLIQNMRKGTEGLTTILGLMAREAFEGRKQRARQLGEEAGTKLLVPMIIMLVLVLVIIMVPAFWSMKL